MRVLDGYRTLADASEPAQGNLGAAHSQGLVNLVDHVRAAGEIRIAWRHLEDAGAARAPRGSAFGRRQNDLTALGGVAVEQIAEDPGRQEALGLAIVSQEHDDPPPFLAP